MRHAVCLEAPRWLAEAAARLNAGFLLTVDYGKRFTKETPNRCAPTARTGSRTT